MDILESAVGSFKEAVWRIIKANPEALTPYIFRHSQSLKRIAGRGVACRTAIDVGVSDGRWTTLARDIWPDARYHLIKAFRHWGPALTALRDRAFRRIDFLLVRKDRPEAFHSNFA